MQAAVRRHDALMRAAISEHSGYVFKTVGDAFCAAFARPEDAVSAMLAVQRDLAAEDFSAVKGVRVRVAIHTGTADERDGDYFGPAVNRVARLLAIGHGGQVLISGLSAGLLAGTLPPQVTLRDLGEHRLRDLTAAERVFQLAAPDLAPDFPTLRSINALPNNLPRTPNIFIGRETEIGEIAALTAQYQLVTLVGSGGVGKTRVALQVAANLLDGSGGGVWFIELAPLASGEYIPATIAHVFGIPLPADGDPVEHLVRLLASKRALVVFDNCEHLVDSTAQVIAALLRGCPRLRILATSRQGLGIAAEVTYRLPSLELPSAAGGTVLTALGAARYAAIVLFVERACAVNNRFALTDENAPIISDICHRLDGLPLAIELAASRVKILSPRQLRERLDERFRVLTSGSRDVLPRQQTIRALIDWSHDLLDERERSLFRRLAIFVNGFTLEAAVAAGSADGSDELDIFDVLASLVDKSLVLAEPDADTLRYRLLESTRAYAAEKLAAAGERELLAGRRLRYLCDDFAELRRYCERTARHTELEDRLATELDDVRAALDGALAGPQVLAGAELLAAISTCWRAIGFTHEGIAWIETYLAALAAGATLPVARLSSALSFLLSTLGQSKRAFELATQAVARARATGDGATQAYALYYYSICAMYADRRDEAELALTEAEAIPQPSAALRLSLLGSRSLLSESRGDYELAARMYEQIRNEYRALGFVRGEQTFACNLALLEHKRGRTQRAIVLTREILPAIRAGRDRQLLGRTLIDLAGFLIAMDDLSGAQAASREAIALYVAADAYHADVEIAIGNLACVHALRGDCSRAATLERYADAALQRRGYERDFTDRTTYERLTAALRAGLTPDDRRRWAAEGAALTPDAALALALAES